MADRNGYIGRAPSDSSVTVARQTFSPTGVTTDFTFASGYTSGYFDVFINGVKMIEGSDYTSTDGSTFSILNGGADSGDVIEGVAYKAFNAATATVGVNSAGTPIGSVNTLNFVGTGNTFALRGSSIDISISGGAGADIFTYNVVADSNTGAQDSITDFLSGTDGLAITLDYSSSTQALTITADVTAAKTSKSAAQDSFTGERGQTVYSTDDEVLYINYNNDNLVTSLDYAIAINPGATATTTVADADVTWTIKGGSGADIITANVNADTIEPGAGIDTINSGRGADTITLTVDGADDVIRLQTNELYTDGTSVDNGSVAVDTEPLLTFSPVWFGIPELDDTFLFNSMMLSSTVSVDVLEVTVSPSIVKFP